MESSRKILAVFETTAGDSTNNLEVGFERSENPCHRDAKWKEEKLSDDWGYYRIYAHNSEYMRTTRLATRRHYYNLEVDTICIPGEIMHDERIQFLCKRCPYYPEYIDMDWDEECDYHRCLPRMMTTLAVHVNSWKELRQYHPSDFRNIEERQHGHTV